MDQALHRADQDGASGSTTTAESWGCIRKRCSDSAATWLIVYAVNFIHWILILKREYSLSLNFRSLEFLTFTALAAHRTRTFKNTSFVTSSGFILDKCICVEIRTAWRDADPFC